MGRVLVGTAGWSIPARHADAFPPDGSHLSRYSRRLPAVEINTSFYRPHRPSTYRRWAETVPAGFRFAVKMPKEITHGRRLADAPEPLARFLGEIAALGARLGPVLVQLPPSLAFSPSPAAGFLRDLRARFGGALACEPRHPTWFAEEVDRLLADLQIARVAADPPVVPRAAEPGGWSGLRYFRLHGAPRMYHSAYAPDDLAALTGQLAGHGGETWCIFDNTAEGAAAGDACTVHAALLGMDPEPSPG